jgi:O-antigen/teichoic acid export membrane protein
VLEAAKVIALSIPFVVLSAGLRGILEAYGAFGLANLVRMPLGMLIFAGPLAAVLLVGPDLVVITWVLLASRVLGFLAYAWAVMQLKPAPLARPAFDQRLVVPLVTAGGWLTLGNIVDPVMGNADQFVIAATISASAVAYHATPSELITKLWIIPAALGTVLFPRFAAQLASEREDIWPLFQTCLSWLFVAVFPTTLTIALFADEILTVWIAAEFARHSAPLMQIFAFGPLANCLATIPFNLVQSSGAARITALLYCVEMPFYLLVLWQLTSRYGLPGAATAWFLRISIDAALLFHFAVRLVPGCRWTTAMVPALLPRMAIVALPFLACLVDDLAVRSAVAATALLALLAGVTWPLATASRAA